MEKEVKEETAEEKKEVKNKDPLGSGGITAIVLLMLVAIFGLAYMKNGMISPSGFPSAQESSLIVSDTSENNSVSDNAESDSDSNVFERNFISRILGNDMGETIVSNARKYLENSPVYKDQYYASGYPDDNYGVCTDVVGIALRDSGYDLMEKVYQDELEHPEDYPSGLVPDRLIDFRRVQNLQIYFKHKAETLTTDVFDTDEWQGGDIVLWREHIGLISDRRNDRGIPYVLHHSGNEQTEYEEDILEKKGEIIGHYRIS